MTTATARAIAGDGEDSFALGTDGNGILLFEGDRERSSIETQAMGALTLAAGRDARSRGARVVIGRADGSVELDDGETRRHLISPHGVFTYASAAIKLDLFATGAFDGVVRLWRVEDGGSAGTLRHGGFIFSLSASVGGSRLLAAGGALLSLWETATGSELWRIPVPDLGFHVWAALTPDGRGVTAIGESKMLRRWTLSAAGSKAEADTTVQVDSRLFTGIRLLPKSDSAVVATADGEVQHLDLDSGRTALLHAASESHIRDFHLSPDARYVASVSEHGVGSVYRPSGRAARHASGDVAARREESSVKDDCTRPSARGTESFLNREESGRIADLWDCSLSPVPRAARIGPSTRQFAAFSEMYVNATTCVADEAVWCEPRSAI